MNDDGRQDQDRQYFIFSADAQYGPLSMQEIKLWRLENRIEPDTMIWEDESQSWVPLSTFRDFLVHPSPRLVYRRDAQGLKLEGTKVYPGGFRANKEKRNYLRIKSALRIEYFAVNLATRMKTSLGTTTVIDNMSAGGLGFKVNKSGLKVKDHIFMKIHTDNGLIEAIGEVVRVTNGSDIGIGFREVKGRDKLLEYIGRAGRR